MKDYMSEPCFLSKKQVREMVGLSYAQIDRLEAQGKFPKRVPLTRGRVVWIKEQMRNRIKERTPIVLIPDEEWKEAHEARGCQVDP
jgi:predicted DNA-binding transcriptional regulator AlpA